MKLMSDFILKKLTEVADYVQKFLGDLKRDLEAASDSGRVSGKALLDISMDYVVKVAADFKAGKIDVPGALAIIKAIIGGIDAITGGHRRGMLSAEAPMGMFG